MNEFLYKLFIKDHNNVKDVKVREGYGKLAGAVGFVSNTIISVAKIIVGVITSSIAVIADGINNLTDAASSVVTLVGFRLAALPEDKEHPYGHARIEYLAGLIVSIIVLFAGFSLGKSSIEKIINPQETYFSYATVAVLAVAIIVKIWQAYFNYSTGKKIDSATIKATAADSRNDAIATSMVLISVIIYRFTGVDLDGYLGLAVAIFIIISGISLIKETSSPLLGEAPDPELVDNIAKDVLAYDGVLGIHDLVVHNYGPGKVFASIHIEVDADTDIMESHDLVDTIEKEVGEKTGIYFVAHMDPVKTNDPVIQKVYEPICHCVSSFTGLRHVHDMRCVPGKTHTNIIFDIIVEADCSASEEEINRAVDMTVKDIDPTYNVVITFDKAYTNL